MSHFDKINGSQNGSKGSSLNQILIANHEQVAKRGKNKGQLPFEHIFGFCKSFENATKNLGWHLNLKTVDIQDPIYTTIADRIDIELNTLYLYVPVYIPEAATQTIFNESVKISFTLTFDSWTTDTRTVITGLDYQLDIGSSSDVNSPKFVIAAHQTEARTAVPKKASIRAVFD